MNCTHETIDCPNHAGAYDCTPFCQTCEGSQGYCPTCNVTALDKEAAYCTWCFGSGCNSCDDSYDGA